MEHREDVPLPQEFDERGALAEITALEVEHVGVVDTAIRDHRQLHPACGREVCKGVPIAIPASQAVVVDLIRHLELSPEIGGVELRGQEAVADIHPGVLVHLATVEAGAVGALLPQDLRAVDVCGGIDKDSAALAHGVVLRLMEGEAPEVPDGAESLPLVARHDALGRVLDDQQTVLSRDGHDRVHLAGHARVVHDDDDLRAARDGGLDLRLVDVHGVGADIHKDQARPVVGKGVGGGGEGEAWQDHLVPGLKLTQEARHIQGSGAGGGQQHLVGVKALFHPLAAAFGKLSVAADFAGGNGLADIFHLVARAGRDVEADHGIVPFCLQSKSVKKDVFILYQ